MFVDRMIARFCYAWVAYWMLFLVQPVRSIYPAVQTAWIVQLSFVIAVTISFWIVQRTKAPKRPVSGDLVRPTDQRFALSVVRVGYVFSIIGLAALLYDKIVLQGIDYSSGIAFARQQWRVLGEERGGSASSVFSALGYIVGSAYFLSLAIVFSRKIDISDRRRLILMLIGLGLLLANSLITGGRSGVLLALAFVSFAFFTGDQSNSRKLFHRRTYRIAPLIFAFLGFGYTLFVFGERAAASDIDVTYYSLSFLSYLGLDVYDWFERFVNSVKFGWLFALANLALSYLSHSFATMAAIVEVDGASGTVVFGYPMSLLAKLGLVNNDGAGWFLSGRFASLPGGLYYQFGFLGMLLFALILGSVGGWVRGSYKWRKNAISATFFCCIVESIFLISPFLFVGDFLFFPFLVIGGIMSLLLVGLIRRRIR